MKIKILKTKVDEDTFVPTLVLSVEMDVEQMIELVKSQGKDEASVIIGEMFFDKLEKVL